MPCGELHPVVLSEVPHSFQGAQGSVESASPAAFGQKVAFFVKNGVSDGLDKVLSASDKVLSEAKKVLSATDKVLFGADKILSEAEKVLSGLHKVLSEAKKVLSGGTKFCPWQR